MSLAVAMTLVGCSDDGGGAAGSEDGVSIDTGAATPVGTSDTRGPSAAPDTTDEGPGDTASADTMTVGEGPDESAEPPIVFDLGVLPDAPELTSACSKSRAAPA